MYRSLISQAMPDMNRHTNTKQHIIFHSYMYSFNMYLLRIYHVFYRDTEDTMRNKQSESLLA